MTDRRTWYEVDTVIGGLQPGLLPMRMQMVKVFDSEAGALAWAEKFRGFLKTQKWASSAIIPTDEEVEFLGGNHCAISLAGVTEKTERKIA